MRSTLALTCLLFVKVTLAYLDISLGIKRQQNHISYTVPAKINDVEYNLAIEMENVEEFVLPLSQKMSKKKKKKHSSNSSQMTAIIKGTSLQGYSFEGWKRFFMEALLFLESRYYHDVNISLSEIQHKKLVEGQNTKDGVITFGPNLSENKIFELIKKGNQYVKKDVVSIYRGVNDKNVHMQLGGFQESFARGMSNGILFYQLNLEQQDGKWKIPIKSVSCKRQKNGGDDIFYIAGSQVSLGISISSPFLKLPSKFSSDLQRNFQTSHVSCKVNQQKRFVCENMTSVDLSLNYIQFKIDDSAFINISLYDLRDSYDQKTKQTVFYIKFVDSYSEYSIGQALFKTYYVSIDMKDKKLLYSPLNRFPNQNYGIYVIRFLIGFGIFTIAAAFGAMLWQMFSDPYTKNKLIYGQDGVRLVSYQKPNDHQFSNQITD